MRVALNTESAHNFVCVCYVGSLSICLRKKKRERPIEKESIYMFNVSRCMKEEE